MAERLQAGLGLSPSVQAGIGATGGGSGGGGGTTNPAGNDTEIQLNDNGTFGATPNLRADKTRGVLAIGGSAPSANVHGAAIVPTVADPSAGGTGTVLDVGGVLTNSAATGNSFRLMDLSAQISGPGNMTGAYTAAQHFYFKNALNSGTTVNEWVGIYGQVDVENLFVTINNFYGMHLRGVANRGNPTITNSYTVRFDDPAIGINKGALWANGDVRISGEVYGDDPLTGVSFRDPIFILDTTPSTSPTDGALVVYGGVGIAGDVNIGNELQLGNLNGAQDSGYIKFNANGNQGRRRWSIGGDGTDLLIGSDDNLDIIRVRDDPTDQIVIKGGFPLLVGTDALNTNRFGNASGSYNPFGSLPATPNQVTVASGTSSTSSGANRAGIYGYSSHGDANDNPTAIYGGIFLGRNNGSDSPSDIESYGVWAEARGAANGGAGDKINYGIYARAEGGDVAWAGWMQGNTKLNGFVAHSTQEISATGAITASRVKFTGSTPAQTLTLPTGFEGLEIKILNAATVPVDIAPTGADTIEGSPGTFPAFPGFPRTFVFINGDWTLF